MSGTICSSGLTQVLYVEDQPISVLIMQALFQQRPQLRLIVADSGKNACDIAPGLKPALLLVDLRLPDLHGSSLLLQLRSRSGWSGIPAIAVTAEPGFRADGSDFIEVWRKPLEMALVLSRLDRLLLEPLSASP